MTDKLSFLINTRQLEPISDFLDRHPNWQSKVKIENPRRDSLLGIVIRREDIELFTSLLKTSGFSKLDHGTKVSIGHLCKKMRKSRYLKSDGLKKGDKVKLANVDGDDPHEAHGSLMERLIELGAGRSGPWEHFKVGVEVEIKHILDKEQVCVAWKPPSMLTPLQITLWIKNLEQPDSTKFVCEDCGKELLVIGVLGWCEDCKEHYEV
jgi:hypothetical protein